MNKQAINKTNGKAPILVTGGCGFIGSNFIRQWVATSDIPVVNLDKLTYAANPANLADLPAGCSYKLVVGDIQDTNLVRSLFKDYRPSAIVHFAAESHVDRSVTDPESFLNTNIHGTFILLQEALAYWQGLEGTEKSSFRFLHVSTDEVFGSLGANDPAFTETTAYSPNSPYSASKAASDHLVRAYNHTYGLPTLITNCSNNYGPYQFPEKLIPLMIANALSGKALPIYGDGMNVRDWLYVEDHCEAIRLVLERGVTGETYNVGGNSEKTNLQVVGTLCKLINEVDPSSDHNELVTFIKDRPGHDRRYAVATDKIYNELGWQPRMSFEEGMRKTVAWYVNNPEWIAQVMSGEYRNWINKQYASVESLVA